ncbi:MAG: Vmh family MBL fold metallo-hydrolase [Flavobacteriales bacterium]
MKALSTVALAALLSLSAHRVAAPLDIKVYNPGENGIFAVSSVLVSGQREAILFDAQFSVEDGQALVDMIRESGKTLTMIYISSGDPDYYFGLEPLQKAFPDVKIVASRSVVKHILETKDAKLEYWGPILAKNAPTSLIVPSVLNDTTLILEGKKIEIKEVNTHEAYLWLPSAKTVFGGVSVYSGMHVWMADSQTKEARQKWAQSLERMAGLKPERVIPGHFLGDIPPKDDAIDFTRGYVAEFEQAVSKSSTSQEIIKTMKALYPLLAGENDLSLSAKVVTKEMEW